MQAEVEVSGLVYDDQPRAEEVDLTFQIGMVGSDGILLASDMKRTHVGTFRGVYRSSSKQPKIHIDGNVAYCCSGDGLAETVARFFCAQGSELSNDSEIERRLVASAQEAVAQESLTKTLQVPLVYRGSALFALRIKSGRFQLWCVDLPMSTAQPISDRVISGDRGNAAAFFLERYFPARPTPIQELAQLAAHTVLLAGLLNPAGIGGLEMLRCTSAEFEKVSEDEIAVLTDKSEKLDGEISASLGLTGRRHAARGWLRWLWK